MDKKALVIAAACAALPACNAGNVSGEIDGRTVSGLTSASFGGVEDIGPDRVFALNGLALGISSCEAGADIVGAQADVAEARRRDVDAVDRALNDHADAINEHIEVDSWFASLTFLGLDINDVREETFDVQDQERDEVRISLAFCLQENEAEVVVTDGVPALDFGSECFVIGEGELTFVLADDDSTLRVFSEDEVEAQFSNDGDKAGDVTVDVTFRGCEELANATADVLEANLG